MACGIWGTLSLGLFATGQYGLPTPTGMDASAAVRGLLYGGGTAQLMSQAIGSGAVTVATLATAAVLMYAVKATGTLRVSPDGEVAGLDLHEHGIVAYPEYVLQSTPGAAHVSLTPQPVGVPAMSPSRATAD
jgi:Amt family ammonium transporter